MRISLLLAREPFGTIVERTLESFLPMLTGSPQEVHWRQRTAEQNPQAQRFWVNVYLNAIVHGSAPRNVLNPVLREFGTSLSRWRRPFQRLYMEMAASPLARRRLSQAAIDLTPGFERPERWLILGGNYKLRLLCRDEELCYSVVKHGFPMRFMEREIQARRSAASAGIPTPELLDADESAGWLLERYIEGTPLNRLASEEEAAAVLDRLAVPLAEWSRATAHSMPVREYALRLLAESRQHLGLRSRFTPQMQGALERVLLLLERRFENATGSVTLATCHGDLQPGNVLQGTTDWVINWEYAGIRQLGYDPLVWSLALRFPEGLAGRLRRFETEGAGSRANWIGHWREDAGGRSVSDRRRVLEILALEELALGLEEQDVEAIQGVPTGLEKVVRGFAEWIEGHE